MPKITPYDLDSKVTSPPVEFVAEDINIPPGINKILEDHGLSEKEKKQTKLEDARKIFNKAGASVENAASTIVSVMQRGETDAGRLRAAEAVLKVQGILNEIDEKQIPQINITINGDANKTLINLVLPTT